MLRGPEVAHPGWINAFRYVCAAPPRLRRRTAVSGNADDRTGSRSGLLGGESACDVASYCFIDSRSRTIPLVPGPDFETILAVLRAIRCQ